MRMLLRQMSFWSLLFLLAFLPAPAGALPSESEDLSQDKVLSEDESLEELKARIERTKLYAKWIPSTCLKFKVEKQRDVYIDFAVTEKYGGSCSADKGESTILDRFRVYRVTKQLLWYDPTRDEWVAFSAAQKKRQIGLYEE